MATIRTRRTFTKNFKQETVKAILSQTATLDKIASEYKILKPLLQRWINDHIAETKVVSIHKSYPQIERRKNFTTEQELKLKIADLYLRMDRKSSEGRSL